LKKSSPENGPSSNQQQETGHRFLGEKATPTNPTIPRFLPIQDTAEAKDGVCAAKNL
jgi:hypothetical protein